jgi:dethiobiotin synthetase
MTVTTVVPDPTADTPLRGPVVVTGTDTGVGKTIVTAALAAAATAGGLRVAVLKPVQTGIALGARGEESDVDTVARLAGPTAHRTLATYPDPLAPLAAARVAERPPLSLRESLDAVRALAVAYDLVLIEGAGGLLVPMGIANAGPWTVADLAGVAGAAVVVVTRAGLGTLNHTALTLEALVRRKLPARLVVGAWPAQPELVHRTNLADLTTLGGPLAGVVAEGAGGLSPETFRASARSWLAPVLHGTLDPAEWSGTQLQDRLSPDKSPAP